MMKDMLALEALEAVARTNEAVAEQISKHSRRFTKHSDNYNMTLMKLEDPIS
jgi:hypothetical protein